MELQLHLMDSVAAETAKRLALAGLQLRRRTNLNRAREIAVLLAHKEGHVTADMVRDEYVRTYGPHEWGNWAGAIFKDPRFYTRNEIIQSATPRRHGSAIRVWYLTTQLPPVSETQIEACEGDIN